MCWWWWDTIFLIVNIFGGKFDASKALKVQSKSSQSPPTGCVPLACGSRDAHRLVADWLPTDSRQVAPRSPTARGTHTDRLPTGCVPLAFGSRAATAPCRGSDMGTACRWDKLMLDLSAPTQNPTTRHPKIVKFLLRFCYEIVTITSDKMANI